MKTTIDRAGRVVIPKAIRERAGLVAGAEVEIRYDNGIVEIEPPLATGHVVEDGGKLFWKSAPGTPPITPEMINQAIEDVRREREDEIIRGVLGLEDRTGH
ncbi:MAG: AbrB/MazE/SpoVT family DNA-binding domain-containing protein [Acidobacteriota bacterium]